MALDKVEQAKYAMLLDREKWELQKHKNFASHGRFASVSGVIGVSLAPVNLPSGAIFLGASVYFWMRYKSMKEKHNETLRKIEQYQLFIAPGPQ